MASDKISFARAANAAKHQATVVDGDTSVCFTQSSLAAATLLRSAGWPVYSTRAQAESIAALIRATDLLTLPLTRPDCTCPPIWIPLCTTCWSENN
jgi:hypothetical protein